MKKLRVVLSVMMAVMVLVSSVYVYSAEATEADSANTEVEEIADVAGETDTETEEISKNEMSEDENIDNKEENNDATENNDVADENIDNSEESEDESKTDDENKKTQEELIEERILEIGFIKEAEFELFEPENGIIGLVNWDGVNKTAKWTKCYLAETVSFSGIYQKGYYGIEHLDLTEDNEEVTGTINHYVTEGDESIVVLTLEGSKGSEIRWTSLSMDKTINRVVFAYNQRVIDNVAYQKGFPQKNAYTIWTRGGVVDDELQEIWVEFVAIAGAKSDDAGLIKSTKVKYEEFNTGIETNRKNLLLETFLIENNSTIGATPGVPVSHQQKTKEEQIEKYSNYYDEDGEFYYVSMYNGERNGNIYSDARLLNQVDFTINESFEGISSNGKTDFTLYEMVTVLSDGKEYSRNIYNTLMKLEGNLGKKIYSLSNVTWKIPEGSKVYGREFLDGNSSYYTWSEVGEITDEYFEIIGGRGTEAASMTFHFSDDKRTGIDDIDFDFNGTRCTVAYDNLDYKGPFLSYFLYDLDNWQEMAKSFGLTPVKRGE